MAKKSDYSLFINVFFNSLKKIGLFIIFRPSIFTIRFFFGSLFTIHHKKGHYSLIIIPHPDPHTIARGYWPSGSGKYFKGGSYMDVVPSHLGHFAQTHKNKRSFPTLI